MEAPIRNRGRRPGGNNLCSRQKARARLAKETRKRRDVDRRPLRAVADRKLKRSYQMMASTYAEPEGGFLMKFKLLAMLALFCGSAATLFGQDLAGTWQGTLTTPAAQLRVVFKIAKAPDGKLTGQG